ncbi:MAG: hypothetical protein ACQXXC_01085 [Methanolinea tarda]
MSERKVCPFMSDPRRIVLCQGKNCAAACPVRSGDGSLWTCGLVDGCAGREGGMP